MRTVVLRVVALSLLLLLALVGVITMRTLQRLPDTLIYFVRDQGTSFTLEPVVRQGGDAGMAVRVRHKVAALSAGPSEQERDAGLASAVHEHELAEIADAGALAALDTIGGVLHDHVIVGRNRELSFRKAGLI